MSNVIQHLYKFSSVHGGLLYAWFPSMHTRVDIVLCSKQGEEALMFVVGAVHEMLCRLEKMANYYDVESELAYLNRAAATEPQPVSLLFATWSDYQSFRFFERICFGEDTGATSAI